jgi:hypothetical protein
VPSPELRIVANAAALAEAAADAEDQELPAHEIGEIGRRLS